MKVYYATDEVQFAADAHNVVTSGTFDGVHVGHQKILGRLHEHTQQLIQQGLKAESVVITYHPHPRLVLFPQQTDLRLLSTLDEKIELMEKHGIDHLAVLPFSKAFAEQSSEEFVQRIVVEKFRTRKLVIGYDHRFGKNREGSFEYLQQHQARYGFEVEEISRQDVDDVAVSSTKIRNALTEGKIETATHFLGDFYPLSGMVIRGKQLGRELGFPTANLQVPDRHKLIPADGIYAVRVRYNGLFYNGMLYIGSRTTLGDNLERTIEVNIFDFEANLYDQPLTVYFVAYLRGEVRFESLAAMQQQLAADRQAALEKLITFA
jgi:riboflavin kinase/FMN adenylyltransferase